MEKKKRDLTELPLLHTHSESWRGEEGPRGLRLGPGNADLLAPHTPDSSHAPAAGLSFRTGKRQLPAVLCFVLEITTSPSKSRRKKKVKYFSSLL